MSTLSSATKRACDACHRRKVRCNGQNPCQNCQQASLTCTFDKPPQKKGPKGSRAKVISELRKTQDSKPGISPLPEDAGLSSPLSSPALRPVEPLPADLVEACIAQFFEKMYNTVPILYSGWIQQKKSEIDTSAESYCVVAALCVYMIVHSGVDMTRMGSPMAAASALPRQHPVTQGLKLVEEIKRMRNQTDYSENPTTTTVVTSFFLSAGHFGLQKYNIAWYYLQEAITFGKIMRIHDEKTYQRRPPGSLDVMNRRLFWLLFVSERAQALHKHRDISFHETIDFPKPEPDPIDDLGVGGLTCLYSLFRIVDSRVSEIWNDLRSENPVKWPQNTAAWLAQLQRQVTEAVPIDVKCTTIQEADLRITQQWLRTIVWQLSTASGCLSSTARDSSMTLRYPIEIAQDLAAVTTRLPLDAMDVHGIGMAEKLFDIAYVLVDVIALMPVEPSSFVASPRDHLSHFLTLITSLRHGEARFVGLLRNKIRENLPDLAATLGLPLAPPPPAALPARSSSAGSPSPYAPADPLPSLRRIDSSQSSASSSYGGVAGLSPIAPAAPRFPGLAARPGPAAGAKPEGGAAGAAGDVGMGMDSADAMEQDPPQKHYQLPPYGSGSGYRPP